MGAEWATWQDFLLTFGAVAAISVPVIWYAMRRSSQLDRQRQMRQQKTRAQRNSNREA